MTDEQRLERAYAAFCAGGDADQGEPGCRPYRDRIRRAVEAFNAVLPDKRSETGGGELGRVAASLASMITEYVDGGIHSGQNWRNGLDAIIERRLQRLRVVPTPPAAMSREATTASYQMIVELRDPDGRRVGWQSNANLMRAAADVIEGVLERSS